jgi:3',5'-cyclic-AMP phosphodiesterase
MHAIAQVTDLHLDDFLADYYKVDTRRNLERILDDIRSKGIADIVLTGDLGLPASMKWLFETIGERGLKARFVLGNHDEAGDFAGTELASMHTHGDGLYYSFQTQDRDYAFLDTSRAVVGESQLEWLAGLVRGSEKGLTIFTHYPILDCGGSAMDKLYPLKNRDAIRDLLKGSGRDVAIFCGHYHTADERKLAGITQYVTPAVVMQVKRGGDVIEPESFRYGYRIIRVDDGKVDSEVVLF